MKRFVKQFYSIYDGPDIADQINNYANQNNLTIITVAVADGTVYVVLFEEGENDESAN